VNWIKQLAKRTGLTPSGVVINALHEFDRYHSYALSCRARNRGSLGLSVAASTLFRFLDKLGFWRENSIWPKFRPSVKANPRRVVDPRR
jgi:hypothetical protein